MSKLYMHSVTGSVASKEDWISSYDCAELENRKISAEEAFEEDDGKTLFEVICHNGLYYEVNKISKNEAMKILVDTNQSNNNKRPYVRIGERGRIEFSIEGTEWKIISYVNVYSKTWSRRVAKLVIDGVQYGTREARKFLIPSYKQAKEEANSYSSGDYYFNQVNE